MPFQIQNAPLHQLRQPRLNSVQSLRALAALMVAGIHAINLQVDPNLSFYRYMPRLFEVLNMGVDIFFVLSGFIIAHSASRYSGWGEGLHFLKKRFIRLNPVYYTATLLFLIVRWHWLATNHQIPGAASILKSVLLFPIADRHSWSEFILPVAWTLCYEWFFYWLFALAITVRSRDKTLLVTTIIIGLVAAQYFLDIRDYRVRFVIAPMLLEFVLGMLVYRWYHFWRSPSTAPAAALIAAGIVLFAVQILWGKVYLNVMPDHEHEYSLPLMRVCFWGIPAALLLAGCIFLEKNGAGSALWNNRRVRLLGDSSYSLYLTHYTVYAMLEALTIRIGPMLNPNLSVIVWLFLAIIVGVIFYQRVERALLRALR